MSERKQWLTVKEFAEVLGITEAGARRWVLERRISSTRVGRLVRIPASEITRITDSGFLPARLK
jgi:excisionase family DNA binding protein